MDGRFSHAKCVGTTLDLVFDAFHLAPGDILIHCFIDKLHAALQVQAKFQPQGPALIPPFKAEAADPYVEGLHKQRDYRHGHKRNDENQTPEVLSKHAEPPNLGPMPQAT